MALSVVLPLSLRNAGSFMDTILELPAELPEAPDAWRCFLALARKLNGLLRLALLPADVLDALGDLFSLGTLVTLLVVVACRACRRSKLLFVCFATNLLAAPGFPARCSSGFGSFGPIRIVELDLGIKLLYEELMIDSSIMPG